MATLMTGVRMRLPAYLFLLALLTVSLAVLACGRDLVRDETATPRAAVESPSPTPTTVASTPVPPSETESPEMPMPAASSPEPTVPATPVATQAAGTLPQAAATEPPAATPTAAPTATPPPVAVVPPGLVIDPQLSLSAYEEVLVGIYESVLPSVVQVEVRTNVRMGGIFGSEFTFVPSEGSGFVWSAEGHIVTNHHVIEDADQVTVVFADETEFPAEVLGSDPDSDLAVLKIEPLNGGLKPVQQGNSDELRVGQLAFAVGSPFGQEFSMTGGIVSALGRVIPAGSGQFSIPQVIQTDTPINPGNSGGPLLDRYGNVIGINFLISTSTGINSGVGFAVPINTAKRIVPVLIEEGDYTYAYLGITGTTVRNTLAEINGLPPGTRGVLLVGIVPDGPADKAGLTEAEDTKDVDGIAYPVDGDIIIAIDDDAGAGH